MPPDERLELTHRYIEQIVSSGLLLDEDLEVLLDSSSHIPSQPRSSSSFPFALVASASALVVCCVCARSFRTSPGILAPPAVATAAAAFLEVWRRRKRNEKRELIAVLISALKNCSGLNKRVCRYVSTRQKVSERSEKDYFDTIDQRVLDHLKRYSENNLGLYKSITATLEQVAKLCPDLLSDYEYYKSLDPTDITKLSGDVVKLMETWYDVQVLLNSKLLSYLGVAFASHIETIDDEIPALVKLIRAAHRDNSRIFLELQDPGLKPAVKQREKSPKEFVTSKLNTSLESTLYNASFVAEKTKKILQAIEEGADKDRLNRSLLDLRDHTLATYESLDVLCRLYGVAANQTKPTPEPSVTPAISDPPQPGVIRFDDLTEAQEENFELYVDEDLDDQQTSTLYEDASDDYVGLMLRELRQSLRQHERFREARRRRGSEDETDYFDFEESEDSKKIPLIPPTQPVKLEKSQEWKSDMLDSIRVISGQRKVEEETFGEVVSDGDD